MLKLNNASNWQSRDFGNITVYSPNLELFALLNENSSFFDKQFWAELYVPFACIIISSINNKITIVRDHIGLEPCYYSLISNKLVFGSNIPDIILQLQKDNHSIVNDDEQIVKLLADFSSINDDYTDKTYYKNIYRVEPGYLLQINEVRSNYICKKICFWQLDQHADTIQYKNDKDYLEHFSSLLDEAVTSQIKPGQTIAAEYSGGLDSTAVLAAAHKNNLYPELFMHTPPSNEDDSLEMKSGKSIIQQLNLKANFIDASEFDTIETLHRCAKYFAGAPPYLFFMFAGNIHQAVAKNSHTQLLSGFGGDQCASGHTPLRYYIPQLYRNGQYGTAWNELYLHYHMHGSIPPSLLKRVIQFFKISHPLLFHKLASMRDMGSMFISSLKQSPFQADLLYPKILKQVKNKIRLPYYPSIRDIEYKSIHGKEVRMRVEYSAILGKELGFQYHYPLLYPKLIDFCFRLPIEQKRRNGVNRYLIRKYIAKSLNTNLYDGHPKSGSGSIMPATIKKAEYIYKQGGFNEMFKELPFQTEINYIIKNHRTEIPTERYEISLKSYSYMFKYYWEHVMGI